MRTFYRFCSLIVLCLFFKKETKTDVSYFSRQRTSTCNTQFNSYSLKRWHLRYVFDRKVGREFVL